jgi:hypothetical protein
VIICFFWEGGKKCPLCFDEGGRFFLVRTFRNMYG